MKNKLKGRDQNISFENAFLTIGRHTGSGLLAVIILFRLQETDRESLQTGAADICHLRH